MMFLIWAGVPSFARGVQTIGEHDGPAEPVIAAVPGLACAPESIGLSPPGDIPLREGQIPGCQAHREAAGSSVTGINELAMS